MANQAKKAHKGAKSARSPKKATGARQGSKTAKVLDLLRRSERHPEGLSAGSSPPQGSVRYGGLTLSIIPGT
jgi:hypothetical protein